MSDFSSDIDAAEEERCLSDQEEEQQDEMGKKSDKITLEGTELCTLDPVQMINNGFIHFRTFDFNKYPEFYRKLAEGQSPKFLIFSCSDSRVCPSIILNLRPGQAFMCRNIGGLVPPFNQVRYSEAGAVIEYAISNLKVENILVMGHSRCGGIEALMNLPHDGSTSNDFIDDWVKIGLPAKAKVKAKYGHKPIEIQRAICEREAVNLSLVNLLTYPYVRAGLANKTLNLMGGHYNFVDGKLEHWGLDVGFKSPLLV